MPFHWGLEATVYLKIFHVESPVGFAVAFIVFLALSVLLETLKCLRLVSSARHEDRNAGVAMCSRGHVVQTTLHCAEVIVNYALMLVVMTFNAWFLVAVVTGSTIGYLLCKYLDFRKQVLEAFSQRQAKETGRKGQDRETNGGSRMVHSHVTDSQNANRARRHLTCNSANGGTTTRHEIVELLSSL